jgi:hypothetical protein
VGGAYIDAAESTFWDHAAVTTDTVSNRLVLTSNWDAGRVLAIPKDRLEKISRDPVWAPRLDFTQSRVATVLTGHNTLRRHLYLTLWHIFNKWRPYKY